MAPVKPRIVITYCTQCQWLLRAGWLAQELLSTFGVELGEVALVREPVASSPLLMTARRSGIARPTAGFRTRRPSSSGCATGSIRAAISAISTGLRTAKARARHDGAPSLPRDPEFPSWRWTGGIALSSCSATTMPRGDVKPAQRFVVARRHALRCTAEWSKAMNVQPVAARLSETRQRRRSSWRRW